MGVRDAQVRPPGAARVGQHLELEVPDEPVWAVADAERLERALLNLLSNAQKYGRAGGTIRVSLQRRPAEVLLVVADDGPGIPEAEQQRIFERFYRPKTSAPPPASRLRAPTQQLPSQHLRHLRLVVLVDRSPGTPTARAGGDDACRCLPPG